MDWYHLLFPPAAAAAFPLLFATIVVQDDHDRDAGPLFGPHGRFGRRAGRRLCRLLWAAVAVDAAVIAVSPLLPA